MTITLKQLIEWRDALACIDAEACCGVRTLSVTEMLRLSNIKASVNAYVSVASERVDIEIKA